MKSIISTFCVIAAVSVAGMTAAHAGEPGKKTLKRIYSAPTYHEPAPQTYYEPEPTYSQPGESDYRNQSELDRLNSIPAPKPTVRQVYTQPRTTYHAPKPTYHAPKPTYHPPKPTYHAPKPTYHAPAPTYHPPKPQPPISHCGQQPSGHYGHGAPTCSVAVPHHPEWVPVKHCEKEIRRIKSTKDGRRRYEVCFSDLMHLPEHKRNYELLERMETAAKRVCRNSTSSFGTRYYRSCREESLEESVLHAAHVPGLVEAYYYKTGKKKPQVKVGKPIYY